MAGRVRVWGNCRFSEPGRESRFRTDAVLQSNLRRPGGTSMGFPILSQDRSPRRRFPQRTSPSVLFYRNQRKTKGFRCVQANPDVSLMSGNATVTVLPPPSTGSQSTLRAQTEVSASIGKSSQLPMSYSPTASARRCGANDTLSDSAWLRSPACGNVIRRTSRSGSCRSFQSFQVFSGSI